MKLSRLSWTRKRMIVYIIGGLLGLAAVAALPEACWDLNNVDPYFGCHANP
jgi:hypothetical protein